jgi:murein DD-endopeptidase MepM/ murein hydrolase activator NlpD
MGRRRPHSSWSSHSTDALNAEPVRPRTLPRGRRHAAMTCPVPCAGRLSWAPTVLGLAALAAATSGALVTADKPAPGEYSVPAAIMRSSNEATTLQAVADRRISVSRSAPRRPPWESQTRLTAEAERMSEERSRTLQKLNKKAAAYSAKIERNRWYLPVDYVALTARYGEYGLWSEAHTGLDFNGDEGDPIYAIADGVITSAGYDGAYGNKTVLTLQDGTEIWYCHQSRYLATTGQQVRGGQQIGAIGSTGNVTGSHLHLEIRPGGAGTVDPYIELAANNVL